MKRKRTVTQGEPKKKQRQQQMSLTMPITPSRGFHEKKNWDERLTNAINVAGGGTAGVINNIFRPAIAATAQGRLGRRTLAKSLAYRWTGELNVTTATTGAALRLLILYDKQTNAALPTVNQVMVNDDIGSMRALEFGKRFVTLVDETVEMVNTVDHASWVLEGYRKLNLDTEFNNTNGQTIADINTGSFFAITWQTGSITTAPTVDILFCRIRFTDT